MAVGREAIEAFRARVEPRFEGGECKVRTNAPMAARIVSIAYPNEAEIHTGISLWFNAEGELVRYLENRGERPKPSRSLDSVQAQMRTLPSTTVQLDPPKNLALAMNTGGDQPNHGVRGTIDEFDASPPFAYLRARVEAVRAACLLR